MKNHKSVEIRNAEFIGSVIETTWLVILLYILWDLTLKG